MVHEPSYWFGTRTFFVAALAGQRAPAVSPAARIKRAVRATDSCDGRAAGTDHDPGEGRVWLESFRDRSDRDPAEKRLENRITSPPFLRHRRFTGKAAMPDMAAPII